MDTFKARKARKHELSIKQKEILRRSLLGDGHLTKTTRGFAFRANHSIKQKKYVDWKYNQLTEITNSAPSDCQNRVYYFRSVAHPFFKVLHKEFYVGRRKIVPKQIKNWISPLTVAVWIMDDGSRDGRQLRINSQSFSKLENKKLISVLEAKLGIKATLNRDKDRYRLRIKDESMEIVREIARKYIIPSMLYKISP